MLIIGEKIQQENGRNEEQLLQNCCLKHNSFLKCFMAEIMAIADGYIMLRVLSICSWKSSFSCVFQNLSFE